MHEPLISVCIVTYNQQAYIRQCIESALVQASDVSLEILVGDDCSDDETGNVIAELAAAYPRLIRCIRNERRLGPTGNVQSVLAMAKGEFVAHLDGDDYWLPGKLKKQIAFMIDNPSCAAVYTNALTVDEVGRPIGVFNDVSDSRFDLAALLRRGNFLNASSMMTRKKFVEQIISIKGPFIDYRAHLRYARNGFVAHLGEPLVGYRVNSMGSMIQGSNDKVRKLYWEAIMDVPKELINELDFAKGLADFFRRVVFRAIKTRRLSLLREWSRPVFSAAPYGYIKMSLLIGCSIVRISCLELLAKLTRRNILYHR